ncbi:globin domain-containing protein [Streptomyces sp. NBC_00047]|uniref:globin domain-containing protein n=1 Tax=unclassified Streptomyces TaxID=2593676 RepID=UPI00214AC14B|nr:MULTISPECIES: globin domain-containing protein [unclassified Streptomyces]MCX5607582.1 globin domain-containing protein [Streptomyces sp. NBC_00047]UUU41682.1 globin domain-containing protein [Streptomyces sp. NBC_00162]
MRILKSSFAVVERRAEHAVKFFYSHLFWHNPGVRELFPASFEDMERQRDRLFAALTHVIAHLENESLVPYLRDLGRDHRKFRAGPEHYAAVGASLLAALAETSGEAWTPQVEKAWAEAYQVIADAMTAGAAASDDPPWWDAEVVRHLQYGEDIGVLTLKPHAPFPYLPGQYTSVSSERVPTTWRTYSIGNAPRPDGTLDLHVSRIERGRLSTALVRDVQPGDTLRLGAAGGQLTFRRADRPASLIAAGTGWAPVRAMLEDLAEHPPDQDVRLFVVARDASYLYDRPLIDEYAAACGWLGVTYITPAPGQHRNQATDRLATALSNRGLWPDQDVYLSGPPHFIERTAFLLEELGARPGRIFYDSIPAAAEDHGVNGRPLGFGEWFLNRPSPHWHNPSGRSPRDF